MFALATRKKKRKIKNKNQANIPFKASSGHFLLLAAKAVHAILNTEAGGPYHCPSQILQIVAFKTLWFFAGSFLNTLGSSSWGGRHPPPSLPLRWPLGSGFLVSLAKILEPISGEAKCQVGPRDPGNVR